LAAVTQLGIQLGRAHVFNAVHRGRRRRRRRRRINSMLNIRISRTPVRQCRGFPGEEEEEEIFF
jgi:hypothetical protein